MFLSLPHLYHVPFPCLLPSLLPSASVQAVEDMCIHKMQERLYQRLSAAVDAHLAQQLQQLQSYLGLDPVSFLDKVYVMWEDYCSQMLTIRSIFLVLDRTYVIGLPGMRSLVDTGLQLLRRHLEQHKRVRRGRAERGMGRDTMGAGMMPGVGVWRGLLHGHIRAGTVEEAVGATRLGEEGLRRKGLGGGEGASGRVVGCSLEGGSGGMEGK